MTDPVQVVAEALEDELIGEIEDFYGDERRRLAPLAARAVAALKAHPDALAALLDSSPHVHRYAVGSSAAEAEPETEWLYEVRT